MFVGTGFVNTEMLTDKTEDGRPAIVRVVDGNLIVRDVLGALPVGLLVDFAVIDGNLLVRNEDWALSV